MATYKGTWCYFRTQEFLSFGQEYHGFSGVMSDGSQSNLMSSVLMDGETKNITAIPKNGSTFFGWEIKRSEGTTTDTSRTITLTSTGTMSTGDVYATAKFGYVVKFYNGSTLLKSENVLYRSSATAPGTDVRGHEFIGWDKSFSTIVSDLSVNGTWRAITYQPSFGGGYGGSIPSYTISSSAQTKTITLPTRTGHSISGWSFSGYDGTAPSISGTTLTIPANTIGNFTATPTWRAHTYSVVFNANNGTGATSTQTGFVYGTSKNLSQNAFTRSGYRFMGWATSAAGAKVYNDGQSVSNLTVTDGGVVNLYAVWSRSEFSVTINNTYQDVTVSVVSGANTYRQNDQGVVSFTAYAGNQYRVNIDYSEGITGSIREALEVRTVALSKVNARRRTVVITPQLGEDANQTWGIIYRAVVTSSTGIIEGMAPPVISLAFTDDTTVGRVIATAGDSAGVAFAEWNNVIPLEHRNDNPVTFSISGDMSLVASYGPVELDVTAEIDDASEEAGCEQGWISVSNQTNPESTRFYYGNVARYSVTVPLGSPFVFAGWYADPSDLVPASTLTTFDVSLTDDTTYYAKFAVRVTIGKSLETSAVGANLELDGYTPTGRKKQTFIGDSGSDIFVIGTELKFSVAVFDGGNFGGWFDSTDTTFRTPLDYIESNTIVVSGVLNIVARILSVALDYYLAFYNVDNETGLIDNLLGLIVPGGGIALTVDEYEEQTGISSLSRGGVFRKFHGVQMVHVRVSQEGTKPFSSITEQRTSGSSQQRVISREPVANVSVLSNLVIRVKWGAVQQYQITATYESIEDIGKGSLSHGDDVVSISSDNFNVVGYYEDGTTFGVIATPKNGYKFAGWYEDGVLVSEDAHFSDTVSGGRTFVAKFVADENAICKWEGAETNKRMVWRSKVYVAPQPFNPSVLRVDTDGYPVSKVVVGTFSAPDANPTVNAEISNLPSQRVVRLPAGRPERYLQVMVESDHEVDAIFVGTSAGGLAI